MADRPRRASDVRLVITDDERRLEIEPGHPVLVISEIGAVIWQWLDGSTDLATIAADLADARETSLDAQSHEVTDFVELLRSRGLVDADESTPSGAPRGPNATRLLEATARGTIITYDFLMLPYEIDVEPGTHPSRDLLLATAEPDSPRRASLDRIVDAIRQAVGDDRTVWAFKLADGVLNWELYYYEHQGDRRDDLRVLFPKVRAAFTEVAGWHAPVEPPTRNAMISFEFSIDAEGKVDPPRTIDVYPNTTPSKAVSFVYELTERGARLKNSYNWYWTHDQLPEVAARLDYNRFTLQGAETIVSDYWLGHLRAFAECDRVYCSSKPWADGIYFHKIRARELRQFLEEFDYPEHLTDWVDQNFTSIDRVRFDLGYDYSVVDGHVAIAKTAVHGCF